MNNIPEHPCACIPPSALGRGREIPLFGRHLIMFRGEPTDVADVRLSQNDRDFCKSFGQAMARAKLGVGDDG